MKFKNTKNKRQTKRKTSYRQKAYRHTALDTVSVLAWQHVKQNLQSKNLKKQPSPRTAMRGLSGFSTMLNKTTHPNRPKKNVIPHRDAVSVEV